MFPDTFKKVGLFVLASIILASGLALLLTGDADVPAAMAVQETGSFNIGFDWPIFLFGIVMGGVVVASILFIVHHEREKF